MIAKAMAKASGKKLANLITVTTDYILKFQQLFTVYFLTFQVLVLSTFKCRHLLTNGTVNRKKRSEAVFSLVSKYLDSAMSLSNVFPILGE